MSERDIDSMYERYGRIVCSRVVNYSKFVFVVEVETNRGERLWLSTGGTADEIYRYDPWATNWSEHLSAGLHRLVRKK